MLDWIRRRLGGIANVIGDVIDAVRELLSNVWSVLTRVFNLWRDAWGRIYREISGWATAFGNWASEVYWAMWRIVQKLIPSWARRIIDQVTRWASRVIAKVENALRAFISNVQKWAVRELNKLGALLSGLRDWATRQINSLLNWVSKIGNRVADLVLHPDRLVAWILPALWGPLWRFLNSKAEVIGRWILGRVIVAVLQTAVTAERIIARIL